MLPHLARPVEILGCSIPPRSWLPAGPGPGAEHLPAREPSSPPTLSLWSGHAAVGVGTHSSRSGLYVWSKARNCPRVNETCAWRFPQLTGHPQLVKSRGQDNQTGFWTGNRGLFPAYTETSRNWPWSLCLYLPRRCLRASLQVLCAVPARGGHPVNSGLVHAFLPAGMEHPPLRPRARSAARASPPPGSGFLEVLPQELGSLLLHLEADV